MEINFNKNLKYLRKINKLSLIELSEITNTSKSTISDYENFYSIPTVFFAEKISNYFKVELNTLFFSIISEEMEKDGNFLLNQNPRTKNEASLKSEIEKLHNDNEKLQQNLRMLTQKINSLELQVKLQDQLKEGKLSEIDLLKTQINLLNDKLKLLDK